MYVCIYVSIRHVKYYTKPKIDMKIVIYFLVLIYSDLFEMKSY